MIQCAPFAAPCRKTQHTCLLAVRSPRSFGPRFCVLASCRRLWLRRPTPAPSWNGGSPPAAPSPAISAIHGALCCSWCGGLPGKKETSGFFATKPPRLTPYFSKSRLKRRAGMVPAAPKSWHGTTHSVFVVAHVICYLLKYALIWNLEV